MKELITEEQANLLILILSIAVLVVSLGYGYFRQHKIEKQKKRLFWAHAMLCAMVGPVIWVFWEVYNSIENYYGLDSLKALKINLCIAIGIGLLFYVLFTLAPRWARKQPTSRPKK
jgi:hypothetical protein